jgi:hypothetical protein
VGFQLCGYSQAITPDRFSLIGIKEGLSNNQVTDVLQDSFGFLWISTKKGLNRYDGKNFIQFFSDSNYHSLPADDIIKMKMLPGNQLAAFTPSGLFLINTKTLLTSAVIIPADSLRYDYKVNVTLDAEGDDRGNIYLLTRSGFYVVNNKATPFFVTIIIVLRRPKQPPSHLVIPL